MREVLISLKDPSKIKQVLKECGYGLYKESISDKTRNRFLIKIKNHKINEALEVFSQHSEIYSIALIALPIDRVQLSMERKHAKKK